MSIGDLIALAGLAVMIVWLWFEVHKWRNGGG